MRIPSLAITLFTLAIFFLSPALSAQSPSGDGQSGDFSTSGSGGQPTERLNITWIGSYSNFWGEPSNWNPTLVPSFIDDVFFNPGSTNYPLLQNGYVGYCANLTVYGGAGVTIREGTLNVNNNFDNYGSYATTCQTMQIASLNVAGNLVFRSGAAASLSAAGSSNISLGGALTLYSGAGVNLTRGTLTLYGPASGAVYVESGSGCRLNNLNIQKDAGAQAYLASPLVLNGGLTITSGAFSSGSYAIALAGGWNNLVGPAAFEQGTGSVTFNGSADQLIPHSEDFHNLVVNKSGGTLKIDGYEDPANFVTCVNYDWVAGSLTAYIASFTASHLTAGFIEGIWYLNGGEITLHCENATSDLGGEIHNHAGILKIYPNNFATSYWPSPLAPVPTSVTMDDGWIEIFGGLTVWMAGDMGPFFTENISGGALIVHGSLAFNTNFSPMGGTLELMAVGTANVTSTGGNLHSFIANATGGVTLLSNLHCNGNVNAIQDLYLNYWQLTCLGDLAAAGTLDLPGNSTLRLTSGHSLDVASGGTLFLHGSEGNEARLTRYLAADRFGLNILPGATVKADWAIFEYLGMDGVNVMAGATVDPVFSFINCFFRYGTELGCLLTLNNSANMLIDSAVFTAGAAMFNVKKTVDSGVVNMVNALGTFAGESYDLDGFERVIWTAPTAAPDLRVIKATFESASAYPGDWIRVTATMVNASTTPSSVPHWIYLYFNRPSAPPLFLNGDTYVRDYNARTGLPYDFTFEFYLWDLAWVGPWTSWLQIDGENEVPESDETNNICGPINTFEFLALPQVADLTIETVPATGAVRLDWTYPIPVTRFNIYRSDFPEGPYTFDDWCLETAYIGNVASPYKFYKVTAERIPPSP